MEEYSTKASDVVNYFKENPLPHHGPPMLYQSMRELDHTRLPDVIQSINREDVFCEEGDRRKDKRRITSSGITKEQEHNADIMVGLLYFMVGGVDEAHDLVLPYSLPCDTEWGGPAVLDSPALGNATYAHALVHRMEGGHVGELGMRGWDNACTWFNETPSNHVMFDKSRDLIQSMAGSLADGDAKHFQKIKGTRNWDFESTIRLFKSAESSPTLTDFCDKVHNSELLTLFRHCNSIVNNTF